MPRFHPDLVKSTPVAPGAGFAFESPSVCPIAQESLNMQTLIQQVYRTWSEEGSWLLSSPRTHPVCSLPVAWSPSKFDCLPFGPQSTQAATAVPLAFHFKRAFWSLGTCTLLPKCVLPLQKQDNLIKRPRNKYAMQPLCSQRLHARCLSAHCLSQNSQASRVHSSSLITVTAAKHSFSCVRHLLAWQDNYDPGRLRERQVVLKSSEADYLVIAGADFKIKHLI